MQYFFASFRVGKTLVSHRRLPLLGAISIRARYDEGPICVIEPRFKWTSFLASRVDRAGASEDPSEASRSNLGLSGIDRTRSVLVDFFENPTSVAGSDLDDGPGDRDRPSLEV